MRQRHPALPSCAPALLSIGLAAMLLGGCGLQPRDASQAESLVTRRQAINQGTHKGVVILPDAAPAAAAPGPDGVAASAPRSFPPLTGRPMNQVKELNGPDIGIALPTR